MIQFGLNVDKAQELQILCLGAHSDDIEIGCGGTLLRLAQDFPKSSLHWAVMSANGVRRDEAQQGAELFAAERLTKAFFQTFPDGFMPFEGTAVKNFLEQLKCGVSPDVIFTHSRRDSHQDHKLLAELTWNTFRNHLILEYEIPKYDGDLGQPTFFVPLATEICQKKVQYLMKAFNSQQCKRWFEPETFLSLLRLRGMECNSPSGYAEAFYCRKLVF